MNKCLIDLHALGELVVEDAGSDNGLIRVRAKDCGCLFVFTLETAFHGCPTHSPWTDEDIAHVRLWVAKHHLDSGSAGAPESDR